MSKTALALQKPFAREMYPRSHRLWLEAKQGEREALEASFSEWLQALTMNEKLFQKNVYENPDLDDWDLRQHRIRLHAILSDGEALAMDFIELGQRTGTSEALKAQIDLIEQKIKTFFDALMAWHGPPSAQADIPDSFKQAAQEVSEGKIVDLDV